MERKYDLVIIGGGPAGYTAALYGARAGLRTLVLEKLSAGGQMALSDQIDNYPGFPDGIDGFTLAEQMRSGAERFGAVTELAEVYSLKLTGNVKEIHSDSGVFFGKTVILATGADPRELGLPEEQALVGRGVHYCAACDGMFYRNKNVVVVGGGDSAVAEALHLSRVARKVTLVHRRDTLRATPVYHQALREAPNVEFLWSGHITGLLRDDRLTGVEITHLDTGKKEVFPCDGVFVSIGRKPATELVAGEVTLDPYGYVVADESTCTNIPGVYAAGDVRTKQLRQVVTAVADGAVAVHQVQNYLSQHKEEI